jgi:hypothetical protein
MSRDRALPFKENSEQFIRKILHKERRSGPIAWPPRSPDLTPLDFDLCGYVKDAVYAPPFQTLLHLRAQITDTIAQVDADILGGYGRK